MPRYLLYFSYIGSQFSGLQWQSMNHAKSTLKGGRKDLKTVQGALEAALQGLKSCNPPNVVSSSRTDAGVHAFCNTAHLDLIHPAPDKHYDPKSITKHVNRSLHLNNEQGLKLRHTRLVNPNFHARHAVVHRKYIYRMAVLRPGVDSSQVLATRVGNLLPMAELKRCSAFSGKFDFLKFEQAAAMLSGTHDVSSFTGSINPQEAFDKETTRTVDIKVRRGRGFLDEMYDPLYANFDFYDVIMQSRGFLYKQVRKTVAAMCGVASERITLDELEHMLCNPSRRNFQTGVDVAPPSGLYLAEVKYDEADLEFDSSSLGTLNDELGFDAQSLEVDSQLESLDLEAVDDESGDEDSEKKELMSAARRELRTHKAR